VEIIKDDPDGCILLKDASDGGVYWWGEVLVIVAYDTPGRKQLIGLKGGETWSGMGPGTRLRPAPDYVVCHRSRVND
jgi:hypothetical protein